MASMMWRGGTIAAKLRNACCDDMAVHRAPERWPDFWPDFLGSCFLSRIVSHVSMVRTAERLL